MHLVLLRGLTRSAWHWQNFPPVLQAGLSKHSIVTPELAGVGERWQEAGANSIAAMVDDIRQQCIALQVQTPVVVIAVSMGAMIATEWAHRYPDEIAQLHLVNTSFGCFSPPWQRLRTGALLSLIAAAIKPDPSHYQLESTILQLTSNRPHSAGFVQSWAAQAKQHPMSRRNLIGQLRASSTFQGMKKAPIEDVRIYLSQKDRLVNPECSRRIAKAWGKPLIQHDWAGHDLSLDDPDWLTERIRDAL